MSSLWFAAPFAAILRIRARLERRRQIGIVTVRACIVVLRRFVRLRPRLMPRMKRCRIASDETALAGPRRANRDRGVLT
jgi:hypothetical protein